MGEPQSFADWQFSRGIVPWVVVHDFSDAYYLRWQMEQRFRFVVRRTAEPLVDAFRGLATAASTVVELIADFADAVQSAASGD